MIPAPAARDTAAGVSREHFLHCGTFDEIGSMVLLASAGETVAQKELPMKPTQELEALARRALQRISI